MNEPVYIATLAELERWLRDRRARLQAKWTGKSFEVVMRVGDKSFREHGTNLSVAIENTAYRVDMEKV